jgi:hypothetical protein
MDLASIVKLQLQSFLEGRAIISYNHNSITIKPWKPPTNPETGVFLERLRDKDWDYIEIPREIQVILDGWLIDVNDFSEYGDIWCLNWMENKYNVLNLCGKWNGRGD